MGVFDAGIEFSHPDLGNVLAKNWGGEVWLFRKLPTEQWLSIRKCTKEDMELLTGMLHEEHGPVMRKKE